MNKFKVKMPSFSSLKNRRLTLLFAGTTAVIFLLILFKWWLSRNNEKGLLENVSSVLTGQEAPDTTEVFVSDPTAPLVKIYRNRKEVRQLKLNAMGVNQAAANYEATQQTMIQEFKKTIHLRMKFPENLDYVELDLEDEVAGILGTSKDLKESFAVLATAQEVNLNQVIDYLNDSEGAMPMLRGHKFLKDQTFEFTPPPSTGLGTMTIIPASPRDGMGLYAALAPRSDGKGTYLFMMEAEASYFPENEDGFEKMLDGLTALP